MATNGSGQHHHPAVADTVYEQSLRKALADVLLDCGFQACTGRSLGLLQAALEHFLLRVGRSARAYAEAAGRTQPVLGDATMSLVDFGVTVSALIDFARQSRRGGGGGQGGGAATANIPAVFGHDWLAEAALRRPTAAPAGTVPDHGGGGGGGQRKLTTAAGHRASHVPEHLPPYPRPHTFVSTPAYRRRADDDVDARRRLAAENRRQTELALTRFLAATGQTHSLFLDDVGHQHQQQSQDPYRLTANELNPRPYVPALMAAISGGTASDEEATSTSTAGGAAGTAKAKPHANHPNAFMRPAKFPL